MEEKAGLYQCTDLNDIVALEPEHKGKCSKHMRDYSVYDFYTQLISNLL